MFSVWPLHGIIVAAVVTMGLGGHLIASAAKCCHSVVPAAFPAPANMTASCRSDTWKHDFTFHCSLRWCSTQQDKSDQRCRTRYRCGCVQLIMRMLKKKKPLSAIVVDGETKLFIVVKLPSHRNTLPCMATLGRAVLRWESVSIFYCSFFYQERRVSTRQWQTQRW